MEFEGYERPNGQLGIRNDVAVIYTASCSKLVAHRIAATFCRTQVFGPLTDFHESQSLIDKLVALGQHPNIASVLIVGLGCEFIDAAVLAARIAVSGKEARHLLISENNGTLKSIQRGSEILKLLRQKADRIPMQPFPIRELVVAMDCSGSDVTSGLASNPAVGLASDLLVEAGATVYCFNVDQELIGMEAEYVGRAVNDEVAAKLRATIPDIQAPPLTSENVTGGITTAKEKAVGAFAKAGSSPLSGVINSFQRPATPGLYLQVPVPGSSEDLSGPQCVMLMAACGAHIVVETTGVGLVAGGVVAVPLKVCANPNTCRQLSDDLDIDASGIITGHLSIDQAGREIYEEILAVARGKQSKSETLGHYEC